MCFLSWRKKTDKLQQRQKTVLLQLGTTFNLKLIQNLKVDCVKLYHQVVRSQVVI